MMTTKETVTKKEIMVIALIGVLLAVGLFMLFPHADAANANATTVINLIVKVLKFIAITVGVIFVLVGIFKFSIAHANEQGPEQQKAIMMMATGLILILLFTLVVTQDVVTNLVNMIQ